MKITVEKYTDEKLAREACEFTMRNEIDSKISLNSLYQCKHSPLRTQQFIIRMYGIPSFVSTHLVRHSAVGQLHFVGTNRDDRGGAQGTDRHTPVDHMMILNAQHLIEMSWKRLCYASHADTTRVMGEIREGVLLVDEELAKHMTPHCLYLGRCDEVKTCGFFKEIK